MQIAYFISTLNSFGLSVFWFLVLTERVGSRDGAVRITYIADRIPETIKKKKF